MARGEIEIDIEFCKGCSLCAHFCARNCIDVPGDRFNPKGYLLPVFAAPDRCNACGICGWMCPTFSIKVFKFTDKHGGAAA